MFFTDARSVDVARVIEGESRDFLLGSAVQDESLTGRGNAINQPAAVGASDQVPLRVERQHSDMSFVTLEEHGMLTLGCDAVDFPTVAGGDVEISGAVESEVPDVLGAGIEING